MCTSVCSCITFRALIDSRGGSGRWQALVMGNLTSLEDGADAIPFELWCELGQSVHRYMGDTSSIFALEVTEQLNKCHVTFDVGLKVYEHFMHTGNRTMMQSLWPSVKKAIEWCIENANKGDPLSNGDPYGLPQRITTTYDHFRWENYRAVICTLKPTPNYQVHLACDFDSLV